MTSTTGATPRTALKRNRSLLLLAAALLLALGLLVIVTGGGRTGTLDPDAYDPAGAHALSVLLEDRGVQVARTGDLPQTVAAASSATTVFVPLPQELSDEELAIVANLPGRVVIGSAGPRTLSLLQAPAEVATETGRKVLAPSCSLGVATNAGKAELGGFGYATSAPGSTGCYDADGQPTLLSLNTGDLVLVGSTELFTNARLAKQGNAALAVGLLGQREAVVWLVPDPTRAALGDRPVAKPDDLLPDWVRSGRLQLFVVIGVLALWRGRRLGRVVAEPLPVIVRAAETTEGRGRLYRASGARGTAAEALRAATREGLARRLGAEAGRDAEVLLDLVGNRTGRAGEDVRLLLYGPAPDTDAALVRLADDLDTLTREVAGS